MECRLFFSRFKNEDTISRMREKIAGMSASRSVHQADALKVGLQAALDLKKRDSRVGLSNETCQSCSRIGQANHLVRPGGTKYERTGRYSWCQGCGKEFALVVPSPT